MAEGYIRGKPNVSWWITQVRQGIEFRKKYAREQQWETWRAYYRGHWDKKILPVNLFFKMLRATVPRVYFRNPRVSVTSARPGPDGMARATILERVDNKMIRQMNMKKHMKAIVQDTFLKGTGIGKLGFGSEFAATPDPVGLETDEPFKDGKYRVEYNSTIEANMPWFMRVPTGQFIVPNGLADFDDARWVAQWIRRPLDDVKDDPRLRNVKDLTATSMAKQTELGTVPVVEGNIMMVDLLEIRDKKSGKVFVIAPYATDKVLLYEDDNLQLRGGVPFYPSTFNLDDEVFWGVPDSQILEPQQREINEIRTQIMRHRRATLIKILIEEGGMTPAEADKILDEDAPAVLFTKESPELIVKVLQAADIPQSLLLAEERVYNDVRENLGFSRNEAGEFVQGSRKPTAAEVNVVRRAADIRVDERRDIMADLLVSVVKDMHDIIFEHWNADNIIDVAGPDGAPVWVRFKGEMLESGRYEVSVDPDAAVPETRDIRRQKAAEAYQLLISNPLIRPDGLTRYFLNELGDVAFDDLMNPVAGPGSPEAPLDLNMLEALYANGGQG